MVGGEPAMPVAEARTAPPFAAERGPIPIGSAC
jgi:hypothetical protein